MKPLTLLSLGLGRDSMTILALLMEGKCLVNGKRTRLDQIDGVVFSDTGAEWEFTMALIPKVTRVCVRAGVPFYWLKKPPMKEVLKFEAVFERQRRKVIKRAGDPYKGHSPYKGAPELRRGEGTKLRAAAPWRRRRYRSIDQKAELGGYHELIPIEQELQLLARIATKARKDCTVRHKIEPIRELLNDLLEVKYDTTLVQWGLGVKAGLLKPNNMLLGLAADEAGRMQEWKPDPRIKPTKAGKWPKKAVRWGVRDVYPLDEGKITKAKEGPSCGGMAGATSRRAAAQVALTRVGTGTGCSRDATPSGSPTSSSSRSTRSKPENATGKPGGRRARSWASCTSVASGRSPTRSTTKRGADSLFGTCTAKESCRQPSSARYRKPSTPTGPARPPTWPWRTSRSP